MPVWLATRAEASRVHVHLYMRIFCGTTKKEKRYVETEHPLAYIPSGRGELQYMNTS